MGILDIIKGKPCQSCGRPMIFGAVYGKNKDGSKNKDFCEDCFQKGSFTDPYLTMEQMIEKYAEITSSKMMISKQKALAMAKENIPKLARWKES